MEWESCCRGVCTSLSVSPGEHVAGSWSELGVSVRALQTSLHLGKLMVLKPTSRRSKLLMQSLQVKGRLFPSPSCSRCRPSDGHLQAGKPLECSGKVIDLPPALASSSNSGEPWLSAVLKCFTKCHVISKVSWQAEDGEMLVPGMSLWILHQFLVVASASFSVERCVLP